MAKHKAPKRGKRTGGNSGGSSGGSVKHAKTRTRNTSRVAKSRTRRPTARNVRSRRATGSGTYRFIDAPPRKDMKRKSPDSAPRLYEWLVSEGYVEPVNTGSATTRGNRRTRGR